MHENAANIFAHLQPGSQLFRVAQRHLWTQTPRVYREAGLLIRRRRRKRLLRAGFVRPEVTEANQEWALDFVHDAASPARPAISRAFRLLLGKPYITPGYPGLVRRWLFHPGCLRAVDTWTLGRRLLSRLPTTSLGRNSRQARSPVKLHATVCTFRAELSPGGSPQDSRLIPGPKPDYTGGYIKTFSPALPAQRANAFFHSAMGSFAETRSSTRIFPCENTFIIRSQVCAV